MSEPRKYQVGDRIAVRRATNNWVLGEVTQARLRSDGTQVILQYKFYNPDRNQQETRHTGYAHIMTEEEYLLVSSVMEIMT